MNAAAFDRRGACPALSAPMLTGDGLLVRLNPVSQGLTSSHLIGLCESASRNGNGTVEITARGSFQIRGLTEQSAAALADDVNGLGIEVRTGVPIDISPLAGIDPTEIADPRPLAEALRIGIEQAGLSQRLGPKVSVVIDAGGHIDLLQISADVRLTAGRRRTGALWRFAIGGTAQTAEPMGASTDKGAIAFAIDLLEQIAELGIDGRARDLIDRRADRPEPQLAASSLAPLALNDDHVALAIALPFGSAKAEDLAALALAAQALRVEDIRLAPGRRLLVLCDLANIAPLVSSANALGFVTDPTDPRLSISACAGAPACASGHIATKPLAEKLATEQPELIAAAGHIHVSGCAKGCAHPAPSPLTLVGMPDGVGVVANGTARQNPSVQVKVEDLPARLPSLLRAATGSAGMEF
jgi:precorrin-3B synthase